MGNEKENNNNNTSKKSYQWHPVWHNAVILPFLHIVLIHSIYLLFTEAKWQTILFIYILLKISTVGVTAGAHRLWSHRAYKAKLPLKIILLVFYTIAHQGTVFQWVRDHRVHHKYTDTDADPHNSTRGFFYSHIGWLLVKKQPETAARGMEIDVSDILDDKLLQFHRKYYYYTAVLLCIIFPTFFPLLWGETLRTAFYVAVIFRYIVGLHSVFLINSAAHMWGTKPYDKEIRPTETKFVSFMASGEGFHNYHHTFPWDYKAAELGTSSYLFNTSRLFIELMAKIGWAYDLKTVSEELIEKRVKRTGDGTHPVWGWGDKDLHIDY